MSTKRMSRSAIERGRPNYNKFERRYSHSQRRVHDRGYLRNVCTDPDYYDAVSEPQTMPVSRQLTDKLGSVYGFLLSRVGRPWSEVFSEVRSRLDERSLAGYHIIRGHVVEEVEGSGYGTWRRPGGHPLYIDDEGILRLREGSYLDPHRKSHNYTKVAYTGPSLKKVLGWAIAPVIDDGGGGLWWARVTGWRDASCCTWRSHWGYMAQGVRCSLGIPEDEHKIEAKFVEAPKNHPFFYVGWNSDYTLYHAYHRAPIWGRWRAFSKQERAFWDTIDDRRRDVIRVRRS